MNYLVTCFGAMDNIIRSTIGGEMKVCSSLNLRYSSIKTQVLMAFKASLLDMPKNYSSPMSFTSDALLAIKSSHSFEIISACPGTQLKCDCFPSRQWIVQGGPNEWPAISPNLSALYYVFGSYLNTMFIKLCQMTSVI